MLFRKGWVGAFVALSALSSIGGVQANNEPALKDLKAFLSIPDRSERFHEVFHGNNAIGHKKCTVSMDSDPGNLLVKIQMENSFLSPAEIELPASGVSGAGDRIEVTKVVQFPEAFLLTTYYERRSGLREKGDMTLIVGRELGGALLSLSISDGEGILSCLNLQGCTSPQNSFGDGDLF